MYQLPQKSIWIAILVIILMQKDAKHKRILDAVGILRRRILPVSAEMKEEAYQNSIRHKGALEIEYG